MKRKREAGKMNLRTVVVVVSIFIVSSIQQGATSGSNSLSLVVHSLTIPSIIGTQRRLRRFRNKQSSNYWLLQQQQSNSNNNNDLISTSTLLLEEIDKKDNKNETQILEYIEQLEMQKTKDDDSKATSLNNRFEPIYGLYDVSYVKTMKENENPVGGKWTRNNTKKILRTRCTYQHILPVNETGCGVLQVQLKDGTIRPVIGEAINVVSLQETIFGGIITIILRGDVIALNETERITNTYKPLSNLSIRALFDPPKIIFGKEGKIFNIHVGPKTTVLLDTSYIDNNIRIGIGGQSGSKFIFKRCNNNDVIANEFRSMLLNKPFIGKYKALISLIIISGFGIIINVTNKKISILLRIGSSILAFFSTTIAALIAFSSGGIEQNDRSVQESKRII